MANINPGITFADGDELTASKLNDLVELATLGKTAITGLESHSAALSTTQQNDFVLPVARSSELADTAPVKMKIGALVPVDDATIERNPDGKLRVKTTGAIAAASAALTGDLTAASAALTGDLTAAGATLSDFLAAGGVSAGSVQASGATPVVQLVDTQASSTTGFYAQITLDGQVNDLYLQGVPRGTGETTGPVKLNTRAPNNSVVLDANGGLTIAAILSAGTLRVNSAAPSAKTDPGLAGTVTWDASYLYLCVASGDWRRIPLPAWT